MVCHSEVVLDVLGIGRVPVSEEDLGQLVLESGVGWRDRCLVDCETETSCVLPVVSRPVGGGWGEGGERRLKRGEREEEMDF